jgi:uncharacterized membrane protein (DUF2068 family)
MSCGMAQSSTPPTISRMPQESGCPCESVWAQYLTIIMTSSLLPLEIYEIAKHVSAGRMFALFINLAIVAYLVSELRTSKEHP